MNFAELKTQIMDLNKQGSLKKQTVEIVVNTQKYSIDSVKTDENFTFIVNRGNYKPFSYVALLNKIENSSKTLTSESKALIQVGDNDAVEINKVFCGEWFIEIGNE